MEEQTTVFTMCVGPEDAPAVGTRMSITEDRSGDRLRVISAVADPGGPWVVARVRPDADEGIADLYLERADERDAARP